MTVPPIPPESPIPSPAPPESPIPPPASPSGPPVGGTPWVKYVAIGCGCLLIPAILVGVLVVLGVVGSIAIPGLERARRQSEAQRAIEEARESVDGVPAAADADTGGGLLGRLSPEQLELLRGATDGDASDIRGRLEAGDPVREDGSYYDQITMDMSSGSGWSVTMRSADFDAFLTLHAPSGATYSDDDSGGGTNARVEIGTAIGEPGEWRIWANSLGAGATGEYTLTFEPLR